MYFSGVKLEENKVKNAEGQNEKVSIWFLVLVVKEDFGRHLI
jgi:hypothetical protein